jgi:hypothetical protein
MKDSPKQGPVEPFPEPQPEKPEISEVLQINKFFTFCLAQYAAFNAFHFGFTFANFNPFHNMLEVQFEWSSKEKNFWISVIGAAPILGGIVSMFVTK